MRKLSGFICAQIVQLGLPELEYVVVTKLADSQETPTLSSDRLMFAADIITAVQGRNLMDLASLVSYPLYVGLGDGQIVASAEELEAMDPEEVFSEQLVKSSTAIASSSFTSSSIFESSNCSSGSRFLSARVT